MNEESDKRTFNVLNHEIVPHHEILSQDEVRQVLETFGVAEDHLPKILSTDPAAMACSAKAGDVLRIVRQSRTAGSAVAYRYVVEYA